MESSFYMEFNSVTGHYHIKNEKDETVLIVYRNDLSQDDHKMLTIILTAFIGQVSENANA